MPAERRLPAHEAPALDPEAHGVTGEARHRGGGHPAGHLPAPQGARGEHRPGRAPLAPGTERVRPRPPRPPRPRATRPGPRPIRRARGRRGAPTTTATTAPPTRPGHVHRLPEQLARRAVPARFGHARPPRGRRAPARPSAGTASTSGSAPSTCGCSCPWARPVRPMGNAPRRRSRSSGGARPARPRRPDSISARRTTSRTRTSPTTVGLRGRPPRARAQVGGATVADPFGGDPGAPLGRDLARLGQPLGRGQHRRAGRGGPSATRHPSRSEPSDGGALDLQGTHPGDEGQAEELGELRARPGRCRHRSNCARPAPGRRGPPGPGRQPGPGPWPGCRSRRRRGR